MGVSQMRGVNGIVLLLFCHLIWFGQWVGFGTLRDLPVTAMQTIDVAYVLGWALIGLGLLKQTWRLTEQTIQVAKAEILQEEKAEKAPR